MTFNASPRMTLPLSIAMIGFALIILKRPNAEITPLTTPIFTETRNTQGETFFIRRVQEAFTHYFVLHAFPAIIWSILIPLQYWEGLRRSRPKLHRITGYITASISLLLTTTGVAFIPRQLIYSQPLLSMHYIYGVPLYPPFSFFAAFVAAPMMLLTGSRAIYLARHKRFAEHRQWATYHGITGYQIPLQRFWTIIFAMLGTLLSQSPGLKAFLGVDRITGIEAISEAERAAFALTAWLGGLTSLAWALYIRHQSCKPRQKAKTVKT